MYQKYKIGQNLGKLQEKKEIKSFHIRELKIQEEKKRRISSGSFLLPSL